MSLKNDDPALARLGDAIWRIQNGRIQTGTGRNPDPKILKQSIGSQVENKPKIAEERRKFLKYVYEEWKK